MPAVPSFNSVVELPYTTLLEIFLNLPFNEQLYVDLFALFLTVSNNGFHLFTIYTHNV